MEALLRRSDNFVSDIEIIGALQIEISARTVMLEGKRIDLAPREFDLLLALVGHRVLVVSRQRPLTDVWRHQGQVVTRIVDTHIAESRSRLEKDAANPKYIKTVRKAGYRFDVP